tara:strand:- start:461 stop:709 length:249 start_codon:yes stop_codon:yes gene_type:complete
MKPEIKYILSNYQQFMEPGEKLAARWLTEDWDGESNKFPSWLRNRIFQDFPGKLLDSPNELAQYILLRILRDHKSEIHFDKS